MKFSIFDNNLDIDEIFCLADFSKKVNKNENFVNIGNFRQKF